MSERDPHHGHGHGGHPHGHDHGHGHADAHAPPMAWEFDEEKLARLSDPGRLETLPPDAIWDVLAARARRLLRVLVDVGTGIGFFALPFARKMPDGLLYACDVSAEALAYLREALRREAEAGRAVANVVPVLNEPEWVPLEDSLADAVVMIDVHHHLSSRPAMLAECRRLLKPGGLLGVIDWKPIETERGPPMEYRFAVADVRAEWEAAGFQDIAEHDIMREQWFLTGRSPA